MEKSILVLLYSLSYSQSFCPEMKNESLSMLRQVSKRMQISSRVLKENQAHFSVLLQMDQQSNLFEADSEFNISP